jgi:NAD(P)-dependent dehydrogenase (short-subunit alcohol dehydrogenase family)/predicted lactoylglutathione lyase
MSSNRGIFTTTVHCATVITICLVAIQYHGWKRFFGPQAKTVVAVPPKKQRRRRRRKSDGSWYDDNDEDEPPPPPRLIVITGCDRGFGRLFVEQMVSMNDFTTQPQPKQPRYIVLALTYTRSSAEELQKLAAAASSSMVTTTLLAMKCDVTSDEDIALVKERVETILKKQETEPTILTPVLYAILNNAGIADPGEFVWFSNLDTYQRVMDTNFFGMLRITQALLPFMVMIRSSVGTTRDNQGGLIINMSSVCGTSASPSNSSYSASKFAIEAWSDSLRLELLPFHIHVVKIRPGQVSTQMQNDWRDRLLQNYDHAPAMIREHLYGGNTYRQKVQSVLDSMTASSSSTSLTHPMHVVQVLLDIVVCTQDLTTLKPHYWIGDDAHTFWKALHLLPTSVADSVKRGLLHFHPEMSPPPPLPPPTGVISHFTIHVRDIAKSIPFYAAFGFEPWGHASQNGRQFLRSTLASKNHSYVSNNNNKWSTLILLQQQDENMKDRGNSSFHAGMTRLCLGTRNLDQHVQRLAKQGIHPMAPPAEDAMAKIAAYYDPDHFVVYLIEMKGLWGMLIRWNQWWNNIGDDPFVFHWTVNVTNSTHALSVFEKLGFETFSDQNSSQVRNELLPAFDLNPRDTIIQRSRMCKLPKDGIYATIMEWVNPRTEKKGMELMSSMTISVGNVHKALDHAKMAGMEIVGEPTIQHFPVFGELLVGTAYVEQKSSPIEFCCFAEKR